MTNTTIVNSLRREAGSYVAHITDSEKLAVAIQQIGKDLYTSIQKLEGGQFGTLTCLAADGVAGGAFEPVDSDGNVQKRNSAVEPKEVTKWLREQTGEAERVKENPLQRSSTLSNYCQTAAKAACLIHRGFMMVAWFDKPKFGARALPIEQQQALDAWLDAGQEGKQPHPGFRRPCYPMGLRKTGFKDDTGNIIDASEDQLKALWPASIDDIKDFWNVYGTNPKSRFKIDGSMETIGGTRQADLSDKESDKLTFSEIAKRLKEVADPKNARDDLGFHESVNTAIMESANVLIAGLPPKTIREDETVRRCVFNLWDTMVAVMEDEGLAEGYAAFVQARAQETESAGTVE